jgi:hypothetical protein
MRKSMISLIMISRREESFPALNVVLCAGRYCAEPHLRAHNVDLVTQAQCLAPRGLREVGTA